MGARGLRDKIFAFMPPWARTGIFEKLDYSLTLIQDAMVQRLDEGVHASKPTYQKTDTALPQTGIDVGIGQGFFEPASSYAVRLKRAIDDWRRAGSNRAVISQILGFLTPSKPRAQMVSNNSAWDTVPAGSDPTTVPTHAPATASITPPSNWTWDTVFFGATLYATYWFRSWAIVDATGWASAPATYAGGKKYSDPNPFSWGSATRSEWFSSLRAIVGVWKGQHTVVPWIVVPFDSTKFVATDAPGSANNPDGNYHFWSKIVGTTRVPARTLNAMYIDGVT